MSQAALISHSMLDDYTSTVSFLAGFFVVVSLFISWYARGDPMVRKFPSYLSHSLTILHRFQLDAIPTIGFSDPILSYLSSLQFYYNGIPMLKEGYEKVICLTSYVPSSHWTGDDPTSRQDQVYSKSQTFGDGWFWQADLNLSMISGGPQMMSFL